MSAFRRVVLILACLICTSSNASSTRAGRTYTALGMLEEALLVQSIRAGGAPANRAELLALMRSHPEVFHPRAEQDDWNRQINYRFPSPDPSRAFDIYSSGPDGKDDGGGGDDVVPWENRGYFRTNAAPGKLLLALAVVLDGPLLALLLAIRFVLRRRATV